MKNALARAAYLAVFAIVAMVGNAAAAELVTSSRLSLYPGKPAETRLGKLIYRGGLVLSSPDRRFGGLSDLAVSADGSRLLTVSDEARWFRAELSYDAAGNLSALSKGEIAPMLGLNGHVLEGKDGDAEGLTYVISNTVDGVVLVSFEREHRVWSYDLSTGMAARPTNVPLGAWTQAQSPNEGLEGIALVSADSLLVVSENAWGIDGGITASLESYPNAANMPNSRSLGIARRPPYMVTSIARGPDDYVYILERRFSLAGGVGMEIRRVKLSEIRAGTSLKGEILADIVFQESSIDNMEGLAARRGPKGETLLYVISDNNFLSLQRNALMLFEVTN